MARITLRNEQERKKAGLETWNGSSTSHRTVSPQSHASRGVRLQQIVEFVTENGDCTRLQIARGIGMKKSPHFVSMVRQLVDEGYLIVAAGTMPNGRTFYAYRIRE